MSSKSKMSKRKWEPLYNLDGTWYTGWQHDARCSQEYCRGHQVVNARVGVGHAVVDMTVKLAGYGRGRSAANFYVEDLNGRDYMMSMSGFYSLLEQVLSKDIELLDGGYFIATFMQTKQGANYFIASYEE